MSKQTALVLSIGFGAGCGAAALAPLVVPPARAQNVTRWEAYCVETDTSMGGRVAAEVGTIGARAGAEGWELVGIERAAINTSAIACFKRPLP